MPMPLHHTFFADASTATVVAAIAVDVADAFVVAAGINHDVGPDAVPAAAVIAAGVAGASAAASVVVAAFDVVDDVVVVVAVNAATATIVSGVVVPADIPP